MSSRCHRIGTGPTHSPSKYLGFIFVTTFIMTDNPSTFIMTPLIPMMITLTTVADITICRVRKEDRGRFLCVGKNKVGNATAPALLKVKCEWKNNIKRWKDKKPIFSQAWDSEVPAIFKVCCQPDASGPCNHVTSDYCDDLHVWHGSGDCNVISIIQYMWKRRDKNDWKGWRRPKGFLDRDWSQSKIQSDLRSGFL